MKYLLPFFAMISISLAAQQTKTDYLLFEGFESGVIPADWNLIDSDGDGNQWEMHPSNWSDAHSGDYSIASYSWFNGSAYTPNNWLISPAIELNSNATLSYYVKAISENFSQEHYQVKLSVSGTETTDFTELLLDETLPEGNNQWLLKEIDLSMFLNETVYIAFVHNQITDMFALKIDDITIAEDTTSTGIFNMNASNIYIYPNPVKNNTINIRTDKTIDEISIYDIIGKPIYTQSENFGNTHQLKIDLKPGQYIMRIKANQQVYNQKIIVQ